MEGSRSTNLDTQKQRILNHIKMNGPSMPIRISTSLGIDSIIVSAFLSELVSDKELKISKMRVGNSPLYYFAGQEFLLDKFANYLDAREKEAFELLKKHGVLEDAQQPPVIRVALRSIGDFALPFEKDKRIYWRFLKMPMQEALNFVEKEIEGITPAFKPPVILSPRIKEDKQLNIFDKELKEIEKIKVEPISKPIKAKPIISVKEKKKIKGKSDFVYMIEGFLDENDFEIVRGVISKKKEYTAIIRKKGGDGTKGYLCIAKDKKSITDKDLMKFLEEGKKDKLSVFVISTGEPSKKAQEWLDYLGGFIKFEVLG